MRVVLVGSDAERAALRRRAGAALEIVGEFATVAAARSADVDFDAILLGAGDHVTTEGDEFEEPLTAREIEVLELLAEGLANKAIADRLGISDQTVKFHVAAISAKLGAANRTDAVRRAVRRGLIIL
jgi:DNA-binding NarL/FixJ family response regulator